MPMGTGLSASAFVLSPSRASLPLYVQCDTTKTPLASVPKTR